MLWDLLDKAIFFDAKEEDSKILAKRRYNRDFQHVKFKDLEDYWTKVAWPNYKQYGMLCPENSLKLSITDPYALHLQLSLNYIKTKD